MAPSGGSIPTLASITDALSARRYAICNEPSVNACSHGYIPLSPILTRFERRLLPKTPSPFIGPLAIHDMPASLDMAVLRHHFEPLKNARARRAASSGPSTESTALPIQRETRRPRQQRARHPRHSLCVAFLIHIEGMLTSSSIGA